MKQGSCVRSVSGWREVDFALNCTHVVHDQPSESGFHLPRAMTSIPHNLTFQYDSDNEVSVNSSVPKIS
ncbi:PR domain zinc finger protein 1 isoform X1 [Tachysurus ichikawai]